MSCGNVALPGSSGPSHWRGGWGRRGARGPSPWPQLTTHRPHHDCGRVTNARGPAACNSHVMTHVPSAGQEARQDTARGLSHSTRGLRGGTGTLSGTRGQGPRSSAGVRVACARVASLPRDLGFLTVRQPRGHQAPMAASPRQEVPGAGGSCLTASG